MYAREYDDLDYLPRHARGARCPECLSAFGHAAGCPADDDADVEAADEDFDA